MPSSRLGSPLGSVFPASSQRPQSLVLEKGLFMWMSHRGWGGNIGSCEPPNVVVNLRYGILVTLVTSRRRDVCCSLNREASW